MSEQITLNKLTDTARVTETLAGKGLTARAASEKAPLFTAAAETLLQMNLPEDAPARAFFIPGRIEILGKHTDYAGGRSIVAAAEHGFCMVAVDRDDQRMRIFADEAAEKTEFEISPDLTPTLGHWSNYPMTVARRLARNFSRSLRGVDVAFRNDLPPAAGMSSSSALIVGSYLVLAGVNGLADSDEYRSNIPDCESLGEYLGTIENGQDFGTLVGDSGVGTFGGSEDHTAILCCRDGQLSQYSYCPVRLERRIELPAEYTLAIASSGVIAEKTGSAREKYNRATSLAGTAVKTWNATTGRSDVNLAKAIASEPDAAGLIRNVLADAKDVEFPPDKLVKRFDHFLAESEQIIPAAGQALARGDMEEFARQVDRSQELTETLLCNQVPETIFLAGCARKIGAVAASAFGAGFGGSVWAMVATEVAEEQIRQWSERYAEAFPESAARARFFTTRPGPGAFAI